MNKISICGSAIIALSIGMSTALAADMPVTSPIVKAHAVPPAPTWSGSYWGLHAGAIRGKTLWLDGPAASTGTFSDTAWALGATIGYNWQAAASPWVLGVEADYLWSNHKAETDSSATFGCVDGCTAQINHVATFRGRAGYSNGPALYYVTGGLAHGWLNAHLLGSGSVPNGIDYRKWGWTVGAGVEAMLGDGWSVKGEYLYLDFGRETDICCLGGGNDGSSEYVRAHVFRFGLNRKFATGKAPVMANY